MLIICLTMFKRFVLLLCVAVISPTAGQSWSKLYRAGEPTTIYTAGTDEWHTSWYQVDDRGHFIFSVKACGHAYLALTEYPGNVTSQSLELRLGVHDNQGSQLAHAQQGTVLFDSSTPDILHCDDYRMFWLRWVNNYIEVGRGNMVGEHKFLNVQQPTGIYYTGIGLRGGHRNAVMWRINENSGRKLRVYTPDNYYYNTMWKSVKGKNFINFAVKACSDVHVVLTERHGDTAGKVYEFVIGGWVNSQSVLRLRITSDTRYYVDTHTGSQLNCDSTRHFHLSWHQGIIEAGHGDVVRGGQQGDQTTILRWQDPSPIDVRYFGISTGHGYTGAWTFDDDTTVKNYVVTRNTEHNAMDRRYNATWIETPRKEGFTFEVQSCNDANILLSQLKTQDGSDIEVAIGTSYNSKTVARMMGSGSSLVEASTPSILVCNEMREFWLSWHNGTLRVGHGSIFYHHDILPHYRLPDGYKVNALSLTTLGSDGLWKFREDMGNEVIFLTPMHYTYQQSNWRTSYKRAYQTFKVKACSDAHIALLPLVGLDYQDIYYDITMGGWNNQNSQVHRIVNDEWAPIGTFYSTPNLLHCDQFTDLWVSWNNSRRIQAGLGANPGHRMLVDVEVPDELTVMSYAVSNGWDHSGEWKLDEDIGDYLQFVTNTTRTDGVPTPYWLSVDSLITSAIFRVDTCADAHVFLMDAVGDMAGKHIEFHLGADNGANCYIKDNGGSVKASATAPTGQQWTRCGTSQQFWISWHGGLIRLGNGTMPGVNVITEWTSAASMSVQGIALESRGSNQAIWRWQDTVAYYTMFDTPVTYGYAHVWKSVEHRQSIAFDVVACSDVHIALTPHPAPYPPLRGYEIVISGYANTRSEIRDFSWERGYVFAEYVDNAGILHCTERRWFWISWDNDAIRVGQGSAIGQGVIMQYLPIAMRDIRAIGFSTGFTYSGRYTINLWDYYMSTPPPAFQEPYPSADNDDTGGSSGVSGLAIGLIVTSCVCIVVGALLVVAIVLNVKAPSSGSLNIPFPLQRYNSRTDEVTIVTNELPPATRDLPSPSSDSAYGSPRSSTSDFPTLP